MKLRVNDLCVLHFICSSWGTFNFFLLFKFVTKISVGISVHVSLAVHGCLSRACSGRGGAGFLIHAWGSYHTRASVNLYMHLSFHPDVEFLEVKGYVLFVSAPDTQCWDKWLDAWMKESLHPSPSPWLDDNTGNSLPQLTMHVACTVSRNYHNFVRDAALPVMTWRLGEASSCQHAVIRNNSKIWTRSFQIWARGLSVPFGYPSSNGMGSEWKQSDLLPSQTWHLPQQFSVLFHKIFVLLESGEVTVMNYLPALSN